MNHRGRFLHLFSVMALFPGSVMAAFPHANPRFPAPSVVVTCSGQGAASDHPADSLTSSFGELHGPTTTASVYLGNRGAKGAHG
jgi:hypothetical protein